MKFDGHYPFFSCSRFWSKMPQLHNAFLTGNDTVIIFFFSVILEQSCTFPFHSLKNNNFMTKFTYVVKIELTRTYRITCDRHGVTFGRCGQDVIKHEKPLKLLSNHSSFLELRGGISSNQLLDH